MRGFRNVEIKIRIGKYVTTHRIRVSESVLRDFMEYSGEEDVEVALEEFCRLLEETVNTFIEKAYDKYDTVDRILARACVYLATELVLAEEALKEGGSATWLE